MDCVDCHNRPAHAFELPEGAVDLRMSQGSISTELPYIRRKAVELLKVNYPDRETARTRIHDGSHTSSDGRTISNDCSACHNLLAMQEENPNVLTDFGLQ